VLASADGEWRGVVLEAGGGFEWLRLGRGALSAVRASGASVVSSRGGTGGRSVSVVGSSSVRIRARRRRRQACPRSWTQSIPASADGVRGGVRAGSAFGQLAGTRGQSWRTPGRRPEGASSRDAGGRRKEQRHPDPSSSDTSRVHRTRSSGRGVDQGGDGSETAGHPTPRGRVPLIRRLVRHGPILTEVADNVKFSRALYVAATPPRPATLIRGYRGPPAGAQPAAPGRGGGTPSALSCLAIRVNPQPSAQSVKSRRTIGACSGWSSRVTYCHAGAAVGPRGRDLDVGVAVDAPAGDVAGARLAEQRPAKERRRREGAGWVQGACRVPVGSL